MRIGRESAQASVISVYRSLLSALQAGLVHCCLILWAGELPKAHLSGSLAAYWPLRLLSARTDTGFTVGAGRTRACY